MTMKVGEQERGNLRRCCPYCHNGLKWAYSEDEYDLGRPWCRAHGRVRMWHVVAREGRNAGKILSVGHLTRHGRLLKTPVRASSHRVPLSNTRWLGHTKSTARRYPKVLMRPLQRTL